MSHTRGASDAQYIQPRARRIPRGGVQELGLSSLPLWHLAKSSEALKSRIVLKGGWQFQAAICHGIAHPSSPCNTRYVCSHHRQCSFHWLSGCNACQRIRRNWPAFKISSQGLLNQLPCLCALMAVCLVICCTLCTLCSSYRLAFYFLQQFLSLCQHLAICSFNAYR